MVSLIVGQNYFQLPISLPALVKLCVSYFGTKPVVYFMDFDTLHHSVL